MPMRTSVLQVPFALITKPKRWFEFIFTILQVFLSYNTFRIRISLVLTDETAEGFFLVE